MTPSFIHGENEQGKATRHAGQNDDSNVGLNVTEIHFTPGTFDADLAKVGQRGVPLSLELGRRCVRGSKPWYYRRCASSPAHPR